MKPDKNNTEIAEKVTSFKAEILYAATGEPK
jgi:hypothetical protein